ncbi:unnamed protein product [Chrysoparadoxa australica]
MAGQVRKQGRSWLRPQISSSCSSPQLKKPKPTLLQRIHATVDAKGEAFFEELAHWVVLHKGYTLLLALAFVGCCATGFMQFELVTAADELWTPQTSKSKTDGEVVSEFFGRSDLFTECIYTVPAGSNVLTMENADVIWYHIDRVRQLEVGGLTYEDHCAMDLEGRCIVQGLPKFFDSDVKLYESLVSSDEELLWALSSPTFTNGTPVPRTAFFGSSLVEEEGGMILSSEAVPVSFITTDRAGEEELLEWMAAFQDLMAELNEELLETFGPEGLSVAYLTTRSFDDELASSVDGEVFLVVLMFVFMGVFLAATLGPAFHPVKGRKLLAGLGILTIVSSMGAAYGLMSGLSIPFTSLAQILPFILVGIGVDDMFIITQAFDRTDPALSTSDRCVTALGRCGMSVTFTSLTDFFGFLLGGFSSFPAVKYFCCYAATAVLFDFFFQVTVFIALLAWDAERIRTGRYDVFFFVYSGKPNSARTGPPVPGPPHVVNPKNEELKEMEDMDEADPQQLDMEFPELSPIRASSPSSHQSSLGPPAQASPLSDWMEHVYAPFLLKPAMKVLVMVVNSVVLTLMIWGLVHADEGLDLSDLAMEGSYAREYVAVARENGLFSWETLDKFGIYFDQLDYASPDVQDEILRLQVEAEEQYHVTGPRESWLDQFLLYEAGVEAENPGLDQAELPFEDQLRMFLDLPQFQRFQEDVVLNDEGSIEMSRVHLYHIMTLSNSEKIRAMLDLRELLDDSSLAPKPFAYSPTTYIWNEQYIVLWRELIVNFGLVLAVVAVLSLVILGRVRYTVLTVLVVAAVDACVTGSIFYWGLEVNSITGIALIMAVGLVVDYNVHLVHYYLNQPAGLTRSKRLPAALGEVGPAIALGVTTTLVGSVPMLFAKSTIFQIFGRMFLSIVCFGGAYGLIVLPVLLSFIPDTLLYPHNAKSIESELVAYPRTTQL